jgi:hypothetical protein
MNRKKQLQSFLAFGLIMLMATSAFGSGRTGYITQRALDLQSEGKTFIPVSPFRVSVQTPDARITAAVSRISMMELDVASTSQILTGKPDFLRISIPGNTQSFELMLYRVDISSVNGFRLETSDGLSLDEYNPIVHYRGMIKGDPRSVVAFSFSQEETMGLICNDAGNFVIGKIDEPNARGYVLYNDKDLSRSLQYSCGTNTTPTEEELLNPQLYTTQPGLLSVNCVNWYYEVDYDIYVNKGSVANVNSYIQGIFNQVATLYDNDGVSIALQTIYVWTSADPYTGPSTSDYLNQFGAYRTSFSGNLANLVGYAGGGGIAYINGLCSSSNSYKMSYSGISSSYNTVPTYSWTVEVITHEDGHLLGSRHTHDCVWNGNNTRIDGCGPQAGYAGSGSCAASPIPSSGTIMSYCHLVSGVGINFNNGFGTQPAALILNKVNTASCLTACSGCPTPPQPGIISGATTYCGSTSQTYSIGTVSGATSYIWTLPSGWSGSSTTNSITVTTSGNGGTLSVIAVNACGNSTARTLTVTGNTAPSQPGNLSGSTNVCQGSSQVYSISAVNGATSYNWTLPSGWSGSSNVTSITATPSANSGTVTVSAVNSCGSSAARSLSVAVGSLPSQPQNISGQSMICANSSYTYSVPLVSGATSYNWTLPSGWSGSSTTNSIIVTTGISSGDISVSASNSCGSGASRILSTQMAAAPNKPNSITTVGGAVKVCPGSVVSYTIDPVTNATSYTWTPPPGATITSGQGTTNVTLTYNIGFVAHDTLFVTANNGCATSEKRFQRIYRDTPGKPSIIIGQTGGVCQLQGPSYEVIDVPGMSYQWTFSQGGASIVSGQGTHSINVNYTGNFTGATLTVTANNACGASNPQTANIKDEPNQPGLISGSTSPCANQQGVPYSIDPVPGATYYTWKVPSGGRINDGTVTSNNTTLVTIFTSVTVNFKNKDGNVKVSAGNSCGSGLYRNLLVDFACREGGDFIAEVDDMVVYPNPASDLLNLRVISTTSESYKMLIRDLSGRIVLSLEGISNEGENVIQQDVSGLIPGIYITELIIGENQFRKRLLIQR